MEIVQQFFEDKDEALFLERCEAAGIEHTIVDENPSRRVYRIPFVADVYYFKLTGEVSLILVPPRPTVI
jgi:hypothetical protein